MAWKHIEEDYLFNHPELVGSVIVAKVGEEFGEEGRCLPYGVELTNKGNIVFTSERRSSYKKNFLFRPFALTEDWTALRRWEGISIDGVVKESGLEPLDNVLDTIDLYYLISKNGKIWATEEGVRLADDYEGQFFLTFIEICGGLYFDCRTEDWDQYWER